MIAHDNYCANVNPNFVLDSINPNHMPVNSTDPSNNAADKVHLEVDIPDTLPALLSGRLLTALQFPLSLK